MANSVSRPVWRRKTIGAGITRFRADGATIDVVPAWNGGTRVTIRRPVVFGEALAGEPTYVYTISHSRHFPTAD